MTNDHNDNVTMAFGAHLGKSVWEMCVVFFDLNKNHKNTFLDFFPRIICDDSASTCFQKSLWARSQIFLKPAICRSPQRP